MRSTPIKSAAVLMLVLAWCGTAHAAAVVGALEMPQCKEGTEPDVRALFARNQAGWQPMTSAASSAAYLTSTMQWSVGFDGRALGSLVTEDPGFRSPYGWTYPRDRILSIVPGQKVPGIVNRGKSFTGWCHTPSTRPLVVVSRGGVADPDTWKPVTPSPAVVSRLFAEFKLRNGKAFLCKDPHSDSGVGFPYQAGDISPSKAYRSKAGAYLITLALKERSDACAHLQGNGWNTQTFLVSGGVSYVGEDIELVDAGDYDGDGVSELVFWHSGHGQDGYIMVEPASGRHWDYLWAYH
jgi:hypothetical protein